MLKKSIKPVFGPHALKLFHPFVDKKKLRQKQTDAADTFSKILILNIGSQTKEYETFFFKAQISEEEKIMQL